MTVAGLVLAGGASTRMGRPKALLPLRGETCVARIVRVLREAGADPILVVTGAHDAVIRDALATPNVLPPPVVVFNPAHESGQLRSLVAGLDALEPGGASAVVVALVDHPAVRIETVASLVETWRRDHSPVVRPVYRGRHGHPVVFDRSVWPALRSAPPDEGARPVVGALGDRVIDVEVDDPGVVLDLDRREDYEALVEAMGRGDVTL